MAQIRRTGAKAFEYQRLVDATVKKWSKFTRLPRPTIEMTLVDKEPSSGDTYTDENRIVLRLGTNDALVQPIILHELAHLMPGGEEHEQSFYANLFTLYQHFGIRKNSEAVWNDIISHAKAAIPAAKAAGILPTLRG